jgi:low temperature requirement protein LtrA
VFIYVAAFGLLGSIAMIFWLIVFGVNEERWREQVSAAGQRSRLAQAGVCWRLECITSGWPLFGP